jgi:RNA polymerase sigma factor (sigma-70 family)
MITTPEEKERLIAENTGLVHMFANRYRERCKLAGFEYDDLYGIGLSAVSKAIDNFDTESGYKFSTYAGRLISGYMQDAMRDNRWFVCAPERGDRISVRSLDSFYIDVEHVADSDAINSICVRNALAKLSDDDRSLLYARLAGATLREIGETEGVTHQAIKCRYDKVRDKLRRMCELQGLEAV